MCLGFQFCIRHRVWVLHFHKESQIRCTLMYISRLIKLNHFQADLIWCSCTFTYFFFLKAKHLKQKGIFLHSAKQAGKSLQELAAP
jgi:hypothetical protein